MVILKATGLQKVYNSNNNLTVTQALKKVDLTIEKGSFTAIMGPSGSGKTTLLTILSGLTEPSAGTVEIMGQDLHKLTRDELAKFRRCHLGYIFQDYNLIDGLTVRENIMLPRILESGDVYQMQQKAEELIKIFSISDIADQYPNKISGGQQQRCAIARALMNDTSLIFADEPTGNLDSKSAKAVMHAFERANLENNATILTVTHDPYTASYGSRVVFIKDGMVITEVYKKADRKAFFNQIIENLAVLEGESNEF